jgi:hypothetical protein
MHINRIANFQVTGVVTEVIFKHFEVVCILLRENETLSQILFGDIDLHMGVRVNWSDPCFLQVKQLTEMILPVFSCTDMLQKEISYSILILSSRVKSRKESRSIPGKGDRDELRISVLN